MNQLIDSPADTPDQLPVPLAPRPAPASSTDPAQPDLNLNYFVPALDGNDPVTAGSFSSMPFHNLPLYIPGLTQKVVEYDGGINLAALEVNLEKGLLCALLPYLGMAALDFIEVFCNDLVVPVARHIVTQDDVDAARIIPLYIPRTRLPDGPADPVFMRLTRVGGGQEETPKLRLKVDTVRPAGIKPNASEAHNANLPAIEVPPDIREYGVTQDDANNGVPFTIPFYPRDQNQSPRTYRAARDRIRLSIGGHIFVYTVTEGEAAGRDPITIILHAGFWATVGSGSHVCEYQIIDEVGNASDGWSPSFVLIVQINDGSEPLLIAAYIDEENPEGVLDHDSLNGADATIRVFVRNHQYAVGDVIRARINGRAQDGTPIITYHDSAPLTSTTVLQISIRLANEVVQALIGGKLQLTYQRIRPGVPDRGSDSSILQVIGTALPGGLLAPHIIEANGGILDPQTLFFNAELYKYPGQGAHDLVTLVMVGTLANGNNFYQEVDEVAGTDNILFFIPNGPDGPIAKLEGGTLRLYCRVTSADGSETRTSPDVTYAVGEPAATLKEVVILQAPGPLYQFDPEKSLGNANIQVSPDPDIQANDTIHLHCEGDTAGGTPAVQDFLVTGAWVGRTIPFTLLRQYIIPNNIMRIYYRRTRDNEPTRFSHEVQMKVGAKLELAPPIVLEATKTGDNTAELNPRHTESPPVVTIRVISDKFPPTADIKLFIIGIPNGIGQPDIAMKPARPEPGTNYVSFTVPNRFVAAYFGGTCTLYYNLLEDGKTTKSEELTLSVSEYTQDELDLLSIPEAQDNRIVKSEGNHVQIDAWAYFAQAQQVFIDLESSTNLALRTGTQVSAAEFIARKTTDLIPAAYVQKLLANDVLEVKARVSMDGTGNKDTAIALKPVSYSIAGQAEVIGTIPVGKGPLVMAITPDSNKLYVANILSGTTTVIDTRTQKVETTLDTRGCFGVSVSSDGTRVYITRSITGNEQVFAYSTTNNSFIGNIVVSQGYWPHGLLANADNTKLFVSTAQNALDIYNIPAHTLMKRINIGLRPTNIYSDIERKSIYILPHSTSQNYYLRFNPNGDSFLSNTPELGGYPRGISFHGNRPRAFYTIDNKVGSLDTALNKLTGELTGYSAARGIACHPTLDLAYVADSLQHTVTVIDTSTDSPKELYKLSEFNAPTDVLASPDGKRVYVINYAAEVISVIRT
ncbi:YncE family protein [Pseudomonas sp. ICBG1301]|uniref:YncE family protein n=1 Tax=Pseudomonas sp. ICBG1301 TaxID=2795987 RepID=UPI001962605A|nr:YncE family protein [Pseudomonas sp. ICBG1301]MBM9487883.1 YncE family protein [Pseudomonas sp. ICBG1301]